MQLRHPTTAAVAYVMWVWRSMCVGVGLPCPWCLVWACSGRLPSYRGGISGFTSWYTHCPGRTFTLPVVELITQSESESEVAQSCQTLCDPMDCSLPGSSVNGILQARVLEWIAISFSRGSSWPRDRTHVSHIAGRCFNLWATRKAQFSGRTSAKI